MADLASILTDPNYVNANAETKAAIFDKFSAQDTNFTKANPATQQAIRVKFGLAAPAVSEWGNPPPQSVGMPGPRATGTAADLIPGSDRPGPPVVQSPTLYSRVRPFVAPTVEALGAAGGAALGTPLGPAGTVAGAGLGYGAAKEAMKLADIYAGGMTPEQAQTEPVRNVLEGATFEAGGRAAAPLIGKALSKAGGFIADIRQLPQQKAAEIARNALGPDIQLVKNMLTQAPEGVTAGQATADITSPTWQALIDRALKRDGRFLETLKQSQGEVSLNALARLAGGETATATRATTENAKAALNTITGPMRETALKGANLGKYVADEASARAANDLAVAASTGGKIDPVQLAAQATGAEAALRSVGVKPLEGAALADKISGITKNPAFAENDLLGGAVQNVADGIRRWTSEGGVIDANALYAIRKNAVDAAIAKLRPGADATTQRNMASSVLSKIKPTIDGAIEAAGGTGWKDYLVRHAQGMQAIGQKNLGAEAMKLYQTNPNAFVELVKGNSPAEVEKIFGPGSYDIAKEMSAKAMETLKGVAKGVSTNVKVGEQVSAGQDALRQILEQSTSKFRIPYFPSVKVTTTNEVIKALEDKVGAKTMTVLTEGFKSGKSAEQLLATLPGSERIRILKLLGQVSGTNVGAAALGTTNALAPQNVNQLGQ